MNPRTGPKRHAVLVTAALLATLPSASRATDMAQLLAAGIPALDRAWTGRDYVVVADALAAGKIPLPVVSDEVGRRLIERFTATENLTVHRDATLPPGRRIDDLHEVARSVRRVSQLYLSASRGRETAMYDEMARLAAFQLHIAAARWDVIEGFLAATDPKDGRSAERRAGRRRVAGGAGQMYAEAALMVSGRSRFSAADRSRLLVAMAETLPRTKTMLPPHDREELRRMLEALRPAYRDADLRNLDAMIAELLP